MTAIESAQSLLAQDPERMSFPKAEVKEFIRTHSDRSDGGVDAFIPNITANRKRKMRPEWKGKTYEEMGYNLFVEKDRDNLMRFVKGVDIVVTP